MNLAGQVNELLLQGYCCSQIIMKLGLDEMHRDNEELVKAMKGLCQGIYSGTVCGTLSAASCLLFLLSIRSGQQLSHELTDWFKEEFGSIDCSDLLGEDPVGSSLKLCPVIIKRTFEEILEIAGRHDLSWSNVDD